MSAYGFARRKGRRGVSVVAGLLSLSAIPHAAADDVDVTANSNAGLNLNAFAGSTARVFPGVTLSNAGTLMPGGTLSAVVATAQSWTLTNQGTIDGSSGNAITFSTNGTVINQGMIDTGFNGVRLSAGGAVDNAAGALIDAGASAVWVSGAVGNLTNAGTMRGSATTVTMSDGGTVTNQAGGLIENLSGANAVSIRGGATRAIVNHGTLRDVGGAFGTGAVIQGGTLTNSATGTIVGTYNAIWAITGAPTSIDNAGQLTATSAGAIELQHGGTVTNSGTMQGAAGIEVLPGGGVVNPSTSVTNSGTITGTGGTAIRFANGTNSVTLQTGSVLNGLVRGGTGADSLTLQGTGTESIAKFLSFETLSMQGADWTLTGAGTFSTSTTVQGGRLFVNGTLTSPAVTVDAAGTLGGSGTIAANVVNNGALAPGNSIGTLNITGNYTQATGSTYVVELDATPASDRLNVTGIATIQANATVTVVAAPGAYNVGTRYTILNALGGVAGTYTGLTGNFAFLDFALAYDPNNVYLDLVGLRATFSSVAQTPNQIATATAAQALGRGNAVFEAILPLDAANARNAFDQLSGVIHASLKSALIDDSSLVRDAVVGRLRQFGDGVHAMLAPVVATMRYADDGEDEDDLPESALAHASKSKSKKKRTKVPEIVRKGPPPAPERVWSGWAQAVGQWGRYDFDGNAAAMSSTTGGVVAGIDATWNGTVRAGIAAGYHATALKESAVASTADVDSYHLVAYAGTQQGPFALRGGAAWTWHDIDTSRTIAFQGFGDAAKAQYDGRTLQVFGEAAYRTNIGPVAVEPFVSLAYVNLKTDGFAESGGAAALGGPSGTEDQVFSTLGVRAAHLFQLGWRSAVIARGALGWRRAFSEVTPMTVLAFTGSAIPFLIEGVPIAQNALVAEAGFDIALNANALAGLTYAGQIAGSAATHAIKGNVTVRF